MAENSYKSLTPIFVLDILQKNTDKYHHITQDFIRRTLEQKPYGISIQRQALGRIINTMLDEDLFLFGNPHDGYWYDRYGYYAEE